MTYKNLMVHLELGRSNAHLLRVAGTLADHFDAGLIGIAVCQPIEVTYGASYVSGEILQIERDEIEKEIKKAKTEFHDALRSPGRTLEWRSSVMFGSLANFVAREARCADLIVTGIAPPDFLDTSRIVNIGDLVMQAGRPVFIVPAAAGALKFDQLVIGWKDTRESRRAVFDALPLLKKAKHVTVAEITTELKLADAKIDLDDVAGWLMRHGVLAEPLTFLSTGDDATQLNAIAREHSADIIVAGAYGHSRLREWALGGVTRDLLLNSAHYSFVSH